MKRLKKICFVSGDNGGCGKYRSFLPAKYLKMIYKDFETSATIGFNPDLLQSYLEQDIVVLQRHSHPDLLLFIADMQRRGKQVWFDIDDMLWEIPSTNIAKAGWSKKALEDMSRIIKVCNVVTTSTEPLAQHLRRLNKNVHVIPNMCEDELPPLKMVRDNVNSRVRVMFAGSNTHAGDFTSAVIHALEHILKNYDIELYFVGYIPPEFNNNKYGDKVRYVEPVDISAYSQTLEMLKPDISIMPLADNFFNMCKSNLKYIESTVAGAVSIGSDIYPYSNTIQHGTTGLLANKAKDWIAALELLICNKEYRNKVYMEAFYDVYGKYIWTESGIHRNWKQYREIIYGV